MNTQLTTSTAEREVALSHQEAKQCGWRAAEQARLGNGDGAGWWWRLGMEWLERAELWQRRLP